MADCELVLRFFAIKETIQGNLKGSLRKLLDDCMERHASDNTETISSQEREYLEFLKTMSDLFDGKPFVLESTGKPSRPLYDALMVALSLHPDKDPLKRKHAVTARLKKNLQTKRSYDVLVGRGNTVDSIKKRVNRAERILFGEG